MATRKPKTPRDKQPKASPVGKAAATRNGTAATSAVSETPVPTVEKIRVRAYQLYLARGATHGQDLLDWLMAEQELLESDTPSSRT